MRERERERESTQGFLVGHSFCYGVCCSSVDLGRSCHVVGNMIYALWCHPSDNLLLKGTLHDPLGGPFNHSTPHQEYIYVMLYINIVLEQPRLISFLAESWQPQLRLTFDWPLSTLVIKSTIQYILYQVLAKFVILLWINSYIRMLVALKLKKLFFLHYHKTKLD